MINTVLFDMDGVLIDSEHFWQQAEKEIFTSVGAIWDDKIALQTTGQTTRAVTELWYKMFPWEGKSIEEVEQAVIDRVDALIREKGQIKAGVLDTLNYLSDNNFKIGLATNSPDSLIHTVLERLEIKKYFQTIVSALHVKEGKPAPDVYLTAAKNLGSNPENCLVVEDSFTGATAGKRAGMTVVSVPDPKEFNDSKFDIADIKIESLSLFQEKIVPFFSN